ncbi:CaiB/BaiF CoA transferase family protein [Devosia naphthalenivorans]|uniref:CaiB/BaiF CoA transferase family protein n=1 Tax=Devosia naphthalenivorans TaxID=2082392 RepID=UPI000D3B914B|nr:CoA transferase [Devosia naphthalenivorans]
MNKIERDLSAGEHTPNSPDDDKKPLRGLRIIDFSWVVAGPMTTKMLGAMGAEVIKIESLTRPEHKQRSGIFRILNNNKRSCTIDISSAAGQALLHRLVAMSDIVVENFSSSVLKKNHLGYEDLRQVRPDLIFVSASGVGRTGPESDALAYGTLLQAYSGRGGLIGKPNELIEAMGILPIWTDPVTAMWETFAVLSAIYHRRRTGKGSFVDLSMLEATVALLPEALMRLSAGVGGRGPGGDYDGESAPGGCFRCSGDDAWIGLSVRDDAEWQSLCQVLGHSSLAALYPTHQARLDDAEAIHAVIAAWCREQQATAAATLLRQAGVPAAVTRSFDQVFSDPEIQRRGVFAQLPDGSHNYTLPWRDADTGWRGDLTPPPELGADNDYVLKQLLGLSDQEYDELLAPEILA